MTIHGSADDSEVVAIFSPAARMRRMLEVEAALARALVRVGVITSAAGDAITAQCDVSRFDVSRISRDAVAAGNDAIPLVERLRALVASTDADAATYVHWGATSQDILDTALVLQLREVFALFDGELKRLVEVLAGMAVAEAATPMVGRTWMQHALPITLGLKTAGWLDGVHRHRVRFGAMRENALVLQFGGAVGTLAALGRDGPAVAAAIAAELELTRPAISWHATRDRVAEVATTMGLLTGTLGKIARDVSLLAQSEVGEATEGDALPGRGRTSTMLHKHNPVACASVLAAAVRAPGLVSTMLAAMIQEHERGLGGWRAEWDVVPRICILAFGALEQTTSLLSGLEIDRARMAANIEATNGALFAEAVTFELAPRIGRSAATAIVQRALRRVAEHGAHLRDVLMDDAAARAHLSPADLERLFDARHYLGAAEEQAKAVADIAMRALAADPRPPRPR